MKLKAYLSGPLFSEAEIQWAKTLRTLIEEKSEGRMEVLWPHEMAPFPCRKIFDTNVEALILCDLMVAILDGPQVDDGTAWETGYFYAKGGKIFGIRTDFRKAGETIESKINLMVEQSCVSISSKY